MRVHPAGDETLMNDDRVLVGAVPVEAIASPLVVSQCTTLGKRKCQPEDLPGSPMGSREKGGALITSGLRERHPGAPGVKPKR